MLVGRESEQRLLDRLIAAARLGTSAALVLVGEPGVGKTALLAHAIDSAGDARVLRATGLEAEQELPFGGQLLLLHPRSPASWVDPDSRRPWPVPWRWPIRPPRPRTLSTGS